MNNAQSVSVASVASSTTQRGVRLHIKKQLAEDIESNGGIQHFVGSSNQNLYFLLKRKFEEDPDVHPYGKRGDVIRKQIRRLVNTWIQKDNEGKYISEVLHPWRIVKWSDRMPQTRRQATRPPQAPDDDDYLSPSEDNSITATAARNPPTSSFTPPRQVIVDAARPPPNTPLTPPTTSFLKMSLNENPSNSSDNVNKRKIGVYDVEDVRTNASKFPGCSESDHFILFQVAQNLTTLSLFFVFVSSSCRCQLWEQVSSGRLYYLVGLSNPLS
jgi:hypothetical protein